MSSESVNDSAPTDLFLSQVSQGDSTALPRLLSHYRDYICRLIELRIEDDLRRRIEPSDVIQEVNLSVMQRIDEYLKQPQASFKIWLRGQVMQQLTKFRRIHLDAQKRSVHREVSLSDVSSMTLARKLLSASPSSQARKNEAIEAVRKAIDSLSDPDREILLLRHVEELNSNQVAELLEIEPAAVRQRYGRAIRRLSKQLGDSISL